MANELSGKTVAILVADGFEQVEMTEPRRALDAAGAKTHLISPSNAKVQGWNHDKKGDSFDIDVPLARANAADYDALILPGGVMNPDTLRTLPEAVAFVRAIGHAGKPIAAICHGPWTLIDAELVKGRRMTSWPSLRIDLQNAGAQWTDAEVVTDRGMVTSRKPADIPAFNRKMIEEIREGKHDRVARASGTAEDAQPAGASAGASK